MTTATARGVAAGTVGVVLMDTFTWWMYRRESAAELEREIQARMFGKDTAHATVRRISKALGSDAGAAQPNAAGILVHFGLGMAPGALYANLRRRHRWLRAGRGALYGFGLFVLQDEIASRLVGVAGPPNAYPWQAHVRGLVGHVILGMVTEATLNVMEDEAESVPA